MEDLQKIKEFFSNPLEEISKEDAWKEFQEKRHVTDKTAAAAKKDFDKGWEAGKYRDGKYSNSLKEVSINDYSPITYATRIASGEMSMEDAMKETGYPYITLKPLVDKIKGLAQNLREEEDPTDIIAMDVPLFIRMLEYAREDAEEDVDLHDVTERAIEATKLRGVLSMDDYDTLVVSKKELDEKMLVPKDKIERMAADIAAKYFSSKTDKKPAINIFKKAVEDSYRALDPDVEIREEEGYSKYLKDDPEFPGGKTKGLTPDTLNKILMKIVQDIDETKQLGENLNEELCPKGKAYLKKRMAAGEKSSAYLSGRAVKVCKGQMKG